jgi:hypothetical protein
MPAYSIDLVVSDPVDSAAAAATGLPQIQSVTAVNVVATTRLVKVTGLLPFRPQVGRVYVSS